MERAKRQEFLERVQRDGFVDDYRGIRISRTGRRFEILRAVVWNVLDEDGNYAGQAATFREWKYLDLAPAGAQFQLTEDFIELHKLLKLTGLAESGGSAKEAITAGQVRINGEPETRKAFKVRRGMRIEYGGQSLDVV